MEPESYKETFSIEVNDRKEVRLSKLISGLNYSFQWRKHEKENGKILFGFVIALGTRLNMPHKVSLKLTRILNKKRSDLKEEEITFDSRKPMNIYRFEFTDDELSLLSKKKAMVIEISLHHGDSNDKENDTRSLTGHVGIINNGCTCYMNSILQLFYHIPAFRKLIFSVDPGDDKILRSLQHLFTMLELSSTAPSTKELIKSFGWNESNIIEQHDVQEFTMKLIDVVETKFKKTPFSGKVGELLCGETITTIQCMNIDFKSIIKEVFYDVPLCVKGMASIEDSLKYYIANSELTGDNKYKTDSGKLDDALRFTKFSKLPPVLQFYLQRIEYDNYGNVNKIKTEYDLKLSIDMGPYCEEQSEEQIYELYCILLHIGSYSMVGHYIALVKKSDCWLRFDDSSVSKVEEEDVLRCSKTDSYYVCYIKKSEKQTLFDDKLKLPNHLIKYYDENRVDRDINTVSVSVDNYDKTFTMERTSKIRSVIKKCFRNSKEVYDVWTGDSMPSVRLDIEKTFGESFGSSAKLFLVPRTVNSTGDVFPFEVYVFNKSPMRLHNFGYQSALLSETLHKFIERILNITHFRVFRFNPREELRTDLNMLQLRNVVPCFLVKPDKDVNLIVNRIESDSSCIYCYDYDSSDIVDKYSENIFDFIDYQSGMTECRVFFDEEVIRIKAHYEAKVSAIVNCITGYKKIPKDQGVALYASQNTVQLLNDASDPHFRSVFKCMFGITNYYCCYAKIKPYSQETIQNMFSRQIHVYNEKLVEIRNISYEAPSTKTVGEMLDYITEQTSFNHLRLVVLDSQTIDSISPRELSLSELGPSIRVEQIPEDQRAIDESCQKLIKCAFVTMDSNIVKYSVFTPFLLLINKDETMDSISNKIVSKQLSRGCSITKYFISQSSDNYSSSHDLSESDILFDKIKETDILCSKIDICMYHKLSCMKSSELKIYH